MTKIVWTEPAVADLEAIHTYIARDSVIYANATVLRILESVEKLERYPLSGRVARDSGMRSCESLLSATIESYVK